VVTEISCQEVWREISNYIDNDVDPEQRARIERHLKNCRHCAAVAEGTSNAVRLLADDHAFELPAGFSERLKQRIVSHGKKPGRISFAITKDDIPLGSHVVYFWKTEEEFGKGIRFLQRGLRDDDFCVMFGHDEANCRVLEILKASGHEIDRLVASGRLTILTRELPAEGTLAEITATFDKARQAGAKVIRYLGNLGSGRKSLPGVGENDVLELEARVTGLASSYPCVMLCMYDTQVLSPRLISKGGMETHPWVCSHSLQQNPKYVPESTFLAALRSSDRT